MRKRFPGEMTVLGGFEMTSQTMRVSDPCYMDLFTRVFHITREQLISKAINDVKLEVE